ncbi:hypothetical protein MMC29_006788 [Sticta canariensis]|nr:hypothetical protein [Sticta canariensis]
MNARYVYMPQVDSGHSTNPAGFEAGESKPKPKLERKSEIPMEEYLSTLKTEQSINMENLGNELLQAFQVDTDQTQRLREIKLSAFLSPTLGVKGNDTDQPSSSNDGNTAPVTAHLATGAQPTTKYSNFDPIVPIRRCTRPVFMTHPESGIGSTKKEPKDYNAIYAGLWSNSKSVSTTQIFKVEDSVQTWSLEVGMSSRSLEGGLSFPIGKATVGSKLGFERERSHQQSSDTVKDTEHFIVLHNIPFAQINLNETTVLLSPDAESDIKKLRKERKFSDLLAFFDKYGRFMTSRTRQRELILTGTFVFQNTTLGGRLYHTQAFSSIKTNTESEPAQAVRKSANASLGIPQVAEVNIGDSSEKIESKKEGQSSGETTEILTWSSIGGNPGLTANPSKWRDSLNEFSSWRPILYENAVRIDQFIGRLSGFSDVPVLFSSILASGLLDRSVIALPPNGLKSRDKDNSPHPPILGKGVLARTGQSTPGFELKQLSTLHSEVAPEGFSWAVFSTDRDIKREIRANLQSSLNVRVNLSYTATFLENLLVDQNSFSIMLRWTSRTFKETWLSKEKETSLKELRMDETKKSLGDFFFRSLTSRAWIVGIWRIQKRKMLDEDFDDLRLSIQRNFSTPHSIEEGCDYISKITTRTEKIPEVEFQLHGSDGMKKNGIMTRSGILPTKAFDIIDGRMRLSGLHFLKISGEVEAYDDEKVPQLSESALIQMQEARASILFLRTKKNREDKDKKATKEMEDEIKDSSDGWLFDSKPFNASIFTRLDKMESRLE